MGCANCDYSLLHTFYEFGNTIRSWNLHQEYPLINKVGQWFQLNDSLVF